MRSSEAPLSVFISSVMTADFDLVRQQAERVIDRQTWTVPWAFEHTPASAEEAGAHYLRKVREADIVLWLVGAITTVPVANEIREAIASNRRLLVFKLPAAERDQATIALIREVEKRVKYVDVEAPANLVEALEMTLGDEIARALRGKPGLGRVATLEELYRASRARCIARWQAAGVPFAQAAELADDPALGLLRTELDFHDKPLVVLIGEIGAGKSLIAERIFQAGVASASAAIDTPLPVYIEAVSLVTGLKERVLTEIGGLGNPQIQGAVVVIDGLDETGREQALELLYEARVLAGSWPGTRVILTTRPIPGISEAEEVLFVPRLLEAEAHALIGRIAGQPVTYGQAAGWPKSIKDAVQRPLFALLLGSHIRDRDERAPGSIGELLASLVVRAIAARPNDGATVNRFLEKLATSLTDRGGSMVPASEVGNKAELQSALASSLIIERQGTIGFPLPILTQWFAAQSLASPANELLNLAADRERLERWRYALIIFVATYSHEAVSPVLRPIVEAHPGIAGRIIEEGVASWGLAQDVSPPPWPQCGVLLRMAMQAWVNGLGELAQFIAPIGDDGALQPLGVRVRGEWLLTAWHDSSAASDDVVQLPQDFSVFGLNPGWGPRRSARPGRQPTWAWRWTFEELVRNLGELLNQRLLPVDKGPLADEFTWRAGLALADYGSLYSGSVSLVAITARLAEYGALDGILAIGGHAYDLGEIRELFGGLAEAGVTQITPPWPGPDSETLGGWVWDPYSDDQILARTCAVYSAAIDAYEAAVDEFFPVLAPQLRTAALLPVCVKGVLLIPGGRGLGSQPELSWYLEPLASGAKNVVDIELGATPIRFEEFKQRMEQFRGPRHAMGVVLHQSALDIFGLSPVTELVYEWLWDDLNRISWVTGMLRR